jgi:hypothetical protein
MRIRPGGSFFRGFVFPVPVQEDTRLGVVLRNGGVVSAPLDFDTVPGLGGGNFIAQLNVPLDWAVGDLVQIAAFANPPGSTAQVVVWLPPFKVG